MNYCKMKLTPHIASSPGDINFAPLLSDIKHRADITVILIHHTQVSPALLACANYSFDFDCLCANISQFPPNEVPPPNTSIVSVIVGIRLTRIFFFADYYLNISNLPRTLKDDTMRGFLSRITNNSGGRIMKIDSTNREAVVSFKCQSDAERCHQRVDNRKLYGFRLSSKFVPYDEPPPPICQPANFPKYLPANLSANQTEPISNGNQVIITNEVRLNQATTTDQFMQIATANKCSICSDSSPKSQHTNYLFRKRVLAVHISLEDLRKRIGILLTKHSGFVPLGSLPQCWLCEFKLELDSVTEPKVMLEHLLNCLEDISITTKEVKVDDTNIVTKFVTFKVNQNGICDNEDKKCDKLKRFEKKLEMLIMKNNSASLTGFPSILLSNLKKEYKKRFNSCLNVKQYEVNSLLELLELVKSNFVVYTFDDDYIITFSFENFINRFAKRMELLLHSKLIQMPIDLNDLPQYLHSFNVDIAQYGVCTVEDLITALTKSDRKDNFIQSNPQALPTTERDAVIVQFGQILLNLLKQQPNFTLEIERLRNHFAEISACLNIGPISPEEFETRLVDLTSLQYGIFGQVHCLTLAHPLRIQELGHRLVRVFDQLYLVCNVVQRSTCNVSIDLSQLFYHYLSLYEVEFEPEVFGFTQLSSLVEEILLVDSHDETRFCLLYTPANTFFHKIELDWKKQQIRLLFWHLSRSGSTKVLLKNFQKNLFRKQSCKYSINFYLDNFVQQFFQTFKDEAGSYCIGFRPISEFARRCLAVMLQYRPTQPRCLLVELEAGHVRHFGTYLSKPSGFENVYYGAIFKSLDWLFQVSGSAAADLTISCPHDTSHFDATSILDSRPHHCLPNLPPSQ